MNDNSEPDRQADGGEPRRQRYRLADFFVDLGDGARGVYPAEQKALDAAVAGEECVIAQERPAAMTAENRLRAKFIRFLILGAGDEIFIHERGVHLIGGYIEGPLELDYVRCKTPLRLQKCEFEKPITGLGAHFVTLDLNGSHCPGVVLDDAHFAASVSMAHGFESNGPVRLTGARIGGDLNFRNAKLINPGSDALACRGIHVGRSVYLTDGFVADGRVRLSSAQIDGELGCYGGHFIQRNAAPTDPYERPRADYALTLTNANIKSVLWLGPWTPPLDKQVKIEGSLNLQGARVATLADDERSWPVKSIVTAEGKRLPCTIALDGFVYDRLRVTSPTKAHIRRKWLMRLPRRSDGEPEFRPQPFEQLISVLKRMGFEQDARRIGLLKEQQLEKVRVQRAAFWARPFMELFGAFWGGFAGFGYRPHRLVVTLFALLAMSSVFFHAAEQAGGFVPADPDVWANQTLMAECGIADWTVCPRVARIMPFNALGYAADTMLPIIDLQQRSNWTPKLNSLTVDLPLIGEMYVPYGGLYAVTWLVNILGALGAILLGAILSGLVARN